MCTPALARVDLTHVATVSLLTALEVCESLLRVLIQNYRVAGLLRIYTVLLPLPHKDVCPDKLQVQWVPGVALVLYV